MESTQPLRRFRCSKCLLPLRSFRSLINHLECIHQAECSFSVVCAVDGCQREYKTVRCLKRHIRKFHRHFYDNEFTTRCVDNNYSVAPISYNVDETDVSDTMVDSEVKHTTADVKKFIAGKFLYLREECKLPYKACSEVSSVCNEILTTCTQNLSAKISAQDTYPDVQNIIVEEGSGMQQILDEFSDYRNLNRYVKQNFSFVQPFQFSVECPSGHAGNSFQYIPILSSLQNLLMHDDVLAEVLQSHESCDENLRDICDGSYMKSHPLFSTSTHSLQIILYHDEFTTANPIGHQIRHYKFAAFYFLLGNISPQFRSQLHVIQLVILAKAKLIKDHGFHRVLSPLLRDLKVLEEDGIKIVNNGTEFLFKGSLAVVVGDNLASHSIGGFMESFSSFRSCRFCMVTRSDIQVSVSTAAFEVRSKASYDAQCSAVAIFPELAKTYGVKRRCCLNDLSYFHAADGLPSDVVHDFFEGGVVCVILQCVISECVRRGYFSLDFLNHNVRNFTYQCTDKLNCPTEVGYSAGAFRVSQKAVQVWCLMRLLPIFVGDLVPVGDTVWELLLVLIDVVELSLAKTISPAQAVFLRDLTKELLVLFKEQFPNQTFKPKAHFVLHYPEQILKFGPLVHLWTMRFEGKHSFFKEAARRTKCNKNLPLSLAARHQYHQALHHESANYLGKQKRSFVGGTLMPVYLLDQSIQALIKPLVSENENFFQSRSVTVDGYSYGYKCAVVTGFMNDALQFKCVMNCLVINETLYLLCSDLETLGFDRHFHAYAVRHVQTYSLLKLDDLLDRHPLGLYEHGVDSFIVLHHRVFIDHLHTVD